MTGKTRGAPAKKAPATKGAARKAQPSTSSEEDEEMELDLQQQEEDGGDEEEDGGEGFGDSGDETPGSRLDDHDAMEDADLEEQAEQQRVKTQDALRERRKAKKVQQRPKKSKKVVEEDENQRVYTAEEVAELVNTMLTKKRPHKGGTVGPVAKRGKANDGRVVKKAAVKKKKVVVKKKVTGKKAVVAKKKGKVAGKAKAKKVALPLMESESGEDEGEDDEGSEDEPEVDKDQVKPRDLPLDQEEFHAMLGELLDDIHHTVPQDWRVEMTAQELADGARFVGKILYALMHVHSVREGRLFSQGYLRGQLSRMDKPLQDFLRDFVFIGTAYTKVGVAPAQALGYYRTATREGKSKAQEQREARAQKLVKEEVGAKVAAPVGMVYQTAPMATVMTQPVVLSQSPGHARRGGGAAAQVMVVDTGLALDLSLPEKPPALLPPANHTGPLPPIWSPKGDPRYITRYGDLGNKKVPVVNNEYRTDLMRFIANCHGCGIPGHTFENCTPEAAAKEQRAARVTVADIKAARSYVFANKQTPFSFQQRG